MAGEAQKFLYATRIGAGLRIEGAGESTGERDDASGQRISALKFWSKDWKSLIEVGSGYWKYAPVDGGIRFFTSYDYRTRFGIVGRILDVVFRPVIGWATAWSFDRLRLWIEKGIPPEVSRDRALIYGVSRLTLAFIWIYHGIVPKLLYHNADELRMLSDAGMPASYLRSVTSGFGWLEICLGLVFLVLWRARWPLWFTIAAMSAATVGVGMTSPSYFTGAFNPVTFNLAVAALAVCGLVSGMDLPSARNCKRQPPDAERES